MPAYGLVGMRVANIMANRTESDMKTMWEKVSDDEGNIRTATQTQKGLQEQIRDFVNSDATRAALQKAFIEGAKFEYEQLVLQAPHSRATRRNPFAETYRVRKERRYAAAAAAYPKPVVYRTVTVDGKYRKYVYRVVDGELQADLGSSNTSWVPVITTPYLTPKDIIAIADLYAHPTEDVAA